VVDAYAVGHGSPLAIRARRTRIASELPEPIGSYAAKVRDRSYRITETDFAGLTSAGLSDDAIFEITVAAAVGPVLQRLDALHVNLVFNVVNRLANAFDFSWDSEEHVRISARVIHRISYRLPRLLVH